MEASQEKLMMKLNSIQNLSVTAMPTMDPAHEPEVKVTVKQEVIEVDVEIERDPLGDEAERDEASNTDNDKLGFYCDVCNKYYVTRTKLVRHIMRVHNQGKYECDECDKTYTHRDSLNRHIKTHKNSKKTNIPLLVLQKDIYAEHQLAKAYEDS